MALEATRRNLELTESLRRRARGLAALRAQQDGHADGRAAAAPAHFRPLLRVGPLNERLDQVETLFNDALLRAELRAALKGLPDLERLTNRVLGGKATPRDLEQIAVALAAVGRVI
jgi:DNA mismatch repair protein MutS